MSDVESDVSSMTEMEWIKFLGTEVVDMGSGRAVIRLVPQSVHLNHNRSVNAPVLYGLAEVAGAAAVVGGMMDMAASAYTVVKEAHIAYLAPARGTVTATGSVDSELFAAGRRRVLAGEAVEVPALVDVVDDSGRLTTQVTLTMSIRPRRK